MCCGRTGWTAGLTLLGLSLLPGLAGGEGTAGGAASAICRAILPQAEAVWNGSDFSGVSRFSSPIRRRIDEKKCCSSGIDRCVMARCSCSAPDLKAAHIRW